MPPQLSKKSEIEINNDISLKIAQFVYEQLCEFAPEKVKGKAIYVILYEYYKKYIIGDKSPASCADFALLLQETRKQEMHEDIIISQALETYIPLQANTYPHMDDNDNQKQETYDCHEYKKKDEQQQQQRKVMVIQGKSGSGKSIFCRHLEETLWSDYKSDSRQPIPIYISLPKIYNKQNEKDIMFQALQGKNVNKEIINVIREKVSFVFIIDGFDEIYDFYRKNEDEQYFYDRFNLNQWNASIIITCRSNVLRDDDIKTTLFGMNSNNTSMIYLWPFTKQQMHSYIEKFAKMNNKNNNDNNNWTSRQYEETLRNYSSLQKIIEEPFLLQLILTILPSLVKQYGVGSNISKAQLYEVFNDQWIDIHSQNIISKLAELRIQMNIDKIKSAFKQYCQDLGFEMFMQGNQVAIESDFLSKNNDIVSASDPMNDSIETKMDEADSLSIWKKYFKGDSKGKNTSKKNENNIFQNVNENKETKTDEYDDSIIKKDAWEEYFNGDSISKYVLRRTGYNKYQFLHKSCQEYYAAQKIVIDIISWKPNTNSNFAFNNQDFQQQFETYVPHLLINSKLLNEELGIIQFIAERIYDINPIFTNLKARLFRIIEASKTKDNVNIAAANAITILNSANINLHYKDWSNIKIPHAILNNAFLEGTNFKNANLDYVNLYQAFLNKANFTNASMNNIYFGEHAYLQGHSDGIIAVQLSPDNSKIVSCSRDSTIRVWDLSSGKQIQLLKGHNAEVAEAQFLPGGSKLVSASWDKTIRIWDLMSGQQIQLLEGHERGLNGVQISADGSKLLSYSTDRTVRLWDISSGKQLQIFSGHSSGIRKAQFVSDGLKIISCSSDGTIRIWDALSGQQIQLLKGHSGSVNGIQLSPNNSKIVSCSDDKTIRIWDYSSGRQIQTLDGHTRYVNAAAFSSDGSKIVSCSDDMTIRIWDIATGNQLQLLEGHSNNVCGVQFFSNDSKILSCSEDNTVRIWDISSVRKNQFAEGHSSSVNDIYFSSDGSKIISCSDDKTIRLWDISSGRQIQIFEGHSNNIYKAQFLPDDSKVISCSSDQTVRIWCVSSGKQLQSFSLNNVWAAQFSSDSSKMLSLSWRRNIEVFDALSGKQMQLLEGHSDGIHKAQFSSDGSKVISCSHDKTVRLWDVLSGKQLQLFEGHKETVNCIQFSLDESKILSGAFDKTIRLWDVLSGKQLLLLEGHSGGINDIQFSPDSSRIVSCSSDKTIRLWDAYSGKQLQIFKGHANIVLRAQFLPDGFKVISYSSDKTIRIWDVSSGQQIQLLEGHNDSINKIRLSPDGSKIVSCSKDRTIRLWGKVIDAPETNSMKCIWRVGIPSYGIQMKDSIWKDANAWWSILNYFGLLVYYFVHTTFFPIKRIEILFSSKIQSKFSSYLFIHSLVLISHVFAHLFVIKKKLSSKKKKKLLLS
ncbi:WD-40 repeat protein [Reticulomyxa filosa]|uniref:WD-40 repeat protein n=1 Tax=Reticulomyxa filosa TaxID=46433 RepID=X6MF73_RETFI|nr:WD-40 repeat protein [Reticulomyxa filosa]|eukprot:ETO11695.1 WD-40 repeat protein [Reticulomyxa filosa]